MGKVFLTNVGSLCIVIAIGICFNNDMPSEGKKLLLKLMVI